MAPQANNDAEDSGNLLKNLMDQASELDIFTTKSESGQGPADLIVEGFE